MQSDLGRVRTRWAAIGAAVAITLGAGGIGVTHAALSAGERTSFVPITPCRLVDTRPGDDNIGDRATPLGAGQSITLEVHGTHGECNLAAGATGVSLNVTALNATQPTYLTLYPTGGGLPTASHLNPAPGQPPTPNAVEVDVNALGQFNVFNGFGTVDVIIDVVGYYEDHDHDDRYYTEAEVDAALAAKANAISTYTRAEIDAQRSGEFTCAAVDFLPSNDGETYFTGTGLRYSNSTTQLSCGVHPPVGARITGLRAAFSDTTAGFNGFCQIVYYPPTQNTEFQAFSTASTTGATGLQVVNSGAGAAVTVTSGFSYAVRCTMPAMASTLAIRAATVLYSFP